MPTQTPSQPASDGVSPVTAGVVAGAVTAVPATAAAVAPAAVAGGAVAAATVALGKAMQVVLAAFAALLRRRSSEIEVVVRSAIAKALPDAEPDEIARLARLEVAYEAEFARKATERMTRDLPGALTIADPEQRKAALNALLARERRYIAQRDDAMLQRAMAAADIVNLKRLSPEGAYWKLSPYVQEHTPDCLALGERFWPWEVLDRLHPPMHHGCPCYLLGLDEAIAAGYMTAGLIPDKADAILRARQIERMIQDLQEAGMTADHVHEHLALLEAGRAPVRFQAGTVKGGEFRPKRGGDAGARVRRGLSRLVPSLRPAAARDMHRGVHVRGRYLRVPERRWERHIDGVKFTSPGGSLNVYRAGELASTPDEVLHPDLLPGRDVRKASAPDMDVATRATAALHAVIGGELATLTKRADDSFIAGDPTMPPIADGEGPLFMPALEGAGFTLVRVSGPNMTFTRGRSVLNVRWDGNAAELVDWGPDSGDGLQPVASDGPPADWKAFRADAMAWAQEIAGRYGATANVPGVGEDTSLYDHTGIHEHSGFVRLGADVRPTIEEAAQMRAEGLPLPDRLRRELYAAYTVTAHEAIGHGVNPITPSLYADRSHAALEEALAEEVGHVFGRERLLEQGYPDVVAWADRNAGSFVAQGTYRQERGALRDILDRAGVPEAERPGLVEDLAFRYVPERRMAILGERLAAGTGMDPDEATQQVYLSFSDVSTVKAGRVLNRPGVTEGIPNYSGVDLTDEKAAGGSNGARFARDAQGNRWLVKAYRGNADRVASEVLANALYRQMGAPAARAGVVFRPADPDFATIKDTVREPPMPVVAKGQRVSTGIVLREPDGRVWVYEPKGHFGGYEHTFPKGGLEGGLTPQQNAHKEVWEETGLHARITGVLGDYEGDTGVTRYYVGVRTGGAPHADDPTPYDPKAPGHGAETAAVKLLTPSDAMEALNRKRDKQVMTDALNAPMPSVPSSGFKDRFPPSEDRPAVAYPALDGDIRKHVFAKGGPSTMLGKHFMTDALLANWDFVGLEDDNVLWAKDGTPIRIDQGGTLEFRAQGQTKPFGPVPTEVWSMRAKGQAKHSVKLTDDDMRAQAADIAQRLTPEVVDELVAAAPFADEGMRARVAENLNARVAWMDRFSKGLENIPGPLKGRDARKHLRSAQADLLTDPDEEHYLSLMAADEAFRTRMSKHLRSGAKDDEAEDAAGLIDAVIADAKASEDFYAFVGVGSTDLPKGKTVRDDDFLTLTLDEDAARKATGVMRVLVPAGTPALSLDALRMAGDGELMLGRRQRLKVLGTVQVDGKTYVDVVAVPGYKWGWAG